MTMKRIQRELVDIKREDLGNIVLEPTDNLQIWRGIIPGPEGSIYEGGVFQVEITLPNDYPFVSCSSFNSVSGSFTKPTVRFTAPRVVFKTR